MAEVGVMKRSAGSVEGVTVKMKVNANGNATRRTRRDKGRAGRSRPFRAPLSSTHLSHFHHRNCEIA